MGTKCTNCKTSWIDLDDDAKIERVSEALKVNEEVAGKLKEYHTMLKDGEDAGEGQSEWIEEVEEFMKSIDVEHSELEDLADDIERHVNSSSKPTKWRGMDNEDY